MRKLLAVMFAVAMATPVVYAKANKNHPMAGCGLGYLLLGNQDNSKIMQVLAATTNGTSGNQTFGITSGTSGCTEDGAVKLAKEAEVFAEVNFETLRHEMAVGEGEFVRTFASLLGAKSADRMVRFFHDRYASLFPSAQTGTTELLDALKVQLAEHPELLS